MGTTITAVNVVGHTLYVAHVGDSRAYLVRHHQPTLLTNDHTGVGELVRMKILSPDKVRTHTQRSVLNKCLGLNLFVQPDITSIPVRNDDIIILCTDGVWSVIEDDEFARLASSTTDPEVISRRILDLAMDRDTDDNLSVLTVHIKHLGPRVEGETSEGAVGISALRKWFKGLTGSRGSSTPPVAPG
jgi:protein phosphatase